MKLQVHSFLPLTLANGPGARCCLWLQGCTLNCPGCFNPETHSQNPDSTHQITEVFDWIQKSPYIEGLTVSGGEPLQQPDALIELLQLVRTQTDLSIILFTGFRHKEASSMPFFNQLTPLIDVLIAGRYAPDKPNNNNFIGSSNKTIHYYSSRYNKADLEAVPTTELIISHTGELIATGIEPLKLSPNLRNHSQ